MRLVRLDLLAFGRFTDVRLDLGPGFHLVFGPNEAGKSTTLRAIRQLLFGFDERTSDNFVHQNPNLRIGGVVSGIKGHQLEVIRRKTRKDSLLDVTSSLAIDETVWNELLCEIDEATFSSRYGINYAQLIEGGREIATGTGDLGEILFATGSGVMDLAAVQKKLVDDAADLFRPQGKKQRLNQAITEWQERRDLVNQNLLLASEWEEVDRQRRETLVRLESISAELTIRSNEANLCRRLLKAQSSVGELDALIRELNEMPIAHRVPANFSNKRQEAQLLLSNSESLQRKEAVTLAEINSELDQISIPARFIENADELTNVLAEWGSFRKAQLDRTGLVERRDRLISQSKDLLDGILKSTNEGDHNVVEIDRDLRIRIAKLGRDQAGLAKTSQQAETRSQRISDQFVRAQAELAALPVIESIDELRNEYRSARADGDLESRLKNLHDEIASVYQERQSKCELMGISVDSLEAIRKMRLPAAEVIRSWESEFETNRAERSLLRARLTDLELAHQKLNAQITEFRSNFQIPSESDLTAVRHRRNELFSEIRRIVQANSVPPISLLESYEQSVEEADDYADKLRKETDRVAQLAEQTSELKSNEERQHDLSVRIAELEAGQVERQRLWTEEWKDLRNAPQLPRELQTWLTRRENLIQIDTLLNCRETEANRIGVQIGKRIQSLSKRLFGSTTTTSNSDSQNEPSQSIDQQSREPRSDSSRSQQQLSFGWEIPSLDEVSSDPSSDEVTHSLVDLLTLAEQKIAQHEQLAFARKEAIETIDRLLNEKKESDDQVQSNKVALEEWAKEWQGIMQQLKLPANSPPDTVASYLEATNELSARQRELEQLRERIDGIDADSAQFQAKFESLCRKIAPDLVEIPIAEAMTKVQSRFADFQKARTAKNELTIRKTNAEQQLANATKMRDQSFLIANELYQIVDRSVPESQATGDVTIGSIEIMLKELTAIEETSKARTDLEDKIERLRERLLELASPETVEEFLDRVRKSLPDQFAAKLQQLERECDELGIQRDRLNQQIGSCDEQLLRMDGRDEAAEAEEQQTQSLAQIRTDAEQFVRLKLAGAVLQTAIERYREKIRGPILKVASDYFRELTLESFEGLRVDEDEKNRPILVGIRNGGRDFVTVDGMSEGTCDQLYLALRLASLQLEHAPRSHLPFIVDDILIQFDDARSAAALKVLARLGTQRQVIFFTHHEHLLEIAQAQLPGKFTAHRLMA